MESSDRRRPGRALRILLLVGLFLLHALPWVGRPAIITGDEPHYLLLAHSIALDCDLAVEDDYRAVAAGEPRAGARQRGSELDPHLLELDGRRHLAHPLGLPLLAAPWLALAQHTPLRDLPDVTVGLLGLLVTFLALLAGWDLLRDVLGSARDASLITFAIYFATPLWFYSRTFYTEPYQWSFLVLSLWLFRRDRMVAGSFLLGWVFLVKEPAALLVLVVLLALAHLRGWRAAARAAIFPALFLVAYLIKNRLQYGHAFVTFQPWGSGDFMAGVVELTFSGQNGLLTLAPVLALAAVGWTLVDLRRKGWPRATLAAGFAFAALFFLTAAWHSPGGGTGYGPRLLVPVIPAFALPLVLTWQRWRDHTWYRVCFLVLTAVGFAWQFVAATHPFNASLDITASEMVTRFPGYFVTGLVLGAVPGAMLLRAPRAAARANPAEAPPHSV